MRIWPKLVLPALLVAILSASAAAQVRRPKPTSGTPRITTSEQASLSEDAKQARTKLLLATATYSESLKKLLELQRMEEERASAVVAKRKEMFDAGIASRREVEESELLLAEVTRKALETVGQMEQADEVVAEVMAAEQLENSRSEQQPGVLHSGVKLIRYTGTRNWSLSEFSKIDTFFHETTGRPMPISAYGQSGIHARLGFDHRGAIDVAVHPDSAEGRALMTYLRSQGIPFIAFRSAVAGSATGAHIHIGPPSHRSSN